MITIWKQNGSGIIHSALLEAHSWVHVTDPTPFEIATLEAEHGVPQDVIADMLDADERSRWEREDAIQIIIMRVPCHDAQKDVPYFTIPLGIILLPELIVTVCLQENPVVSDLSENKVRHLNLHNKNNFILNVFVRTLSYFLRYLKEINRQTSVIEQELHRSVRNDELVRLLRMEKALVYFTTSLKSNELLLDKLKRTTLHALTEEESDILEDIETEQRQTIEMSNIYSNILTGMMDAFASVISNNLNVVMKRLTIISIVLMIPTFFASLYGMNVALPFQHSPFAFLGIVVVSGFAAGISGLLFSYFNRRWKF